MSTAMDLLNQVTGCSATSMWWPASLEKMFRESWHGNLQFLLPGMLWVQFGAPYFVWHVLEIEISTLPNGNFE